MTAATRVVRFAAWTLPKRIRYRYREQWMADLRDADEAGVRPTEIVVGSLVFAATFARPIGGGRRPNAETVRRRSRLAIGLSLSVALLALSASANIVSGGLTLVGNSDFDFAVLALTELLFAYAALAVLSAVVLVTVTRGTDPHVRWGVAIYGVASLTPVLQLVLDQRPTLIDMPFPTAGAPSYLLGVVLVAFASLIVWRGNRGLVDRPTSEPRRRRLLFSGLGALGVLVVAGTGFGFAALLFSQRPEAEFGPDPTMPGYAVWIEFVDSMYQLVRTAFVVWAVLGVVAVCIVFAAGFAARMAVPRIAALALAVVCTALIANGAMLGFLSTTFTWFGQSIDAPSSASQALMLFGRWALVVVILVAVGGLDFWRWRLTGPRERQDPKVA